MNEKYRVMNQYVQICYTISKIEFHNSNISELELHSRAACQRHYRPVGPNTGINPGGRQNRKK